MEETSVQGLYGCWSDLYMWVWQAYQLTDDSWNPAGIGDACNVRLPFGKVVNSAYLINYCLTDNRNSQWHSTEDYQSSSRAADNRFHGPFYMRFIQYNGASEADSETGRFAARDRTNLHCPLFDLGNISDSAGNRASVLLHESWHHWQYKHHFKTDHIGGCSNGECDYYYFHGVGAYEFGQFDRYDTNPSHLLFHSPYQVCAELEGDFAENAKPFVPTVVTQTARNLGNIRLNICFANAVGYRIGDPRPW
ncbi:hypothetical protein ACH4PU_12195 [Streptomyces sp. NPDC021100]|uniref:hypothetical protein n=1 Tax=Streptomyces sp. NPDC021100 TaxID=3365114 RepID=UPI003796BD8B